MAQKYTRNMIRNVFIEMLDERPFDEITVTDLVTRCEINRKTFYYYYQDLYAVLTEIFASELEAVLGGVQVMAFAPARMVARMLSPVLPPEATMGISG